MGAAYAWSTLDGGPDATAAARADADWFMTRHTRALTGASAESYVLAHALECDPPRRERYAAFLRAHFVEPMGRTETAWWLGHGGRAALDLHALVYCHERLGRDPRLLAQMARAACAMFGRGSLTSIDRLIGRRGLTHDEWIYLCFGGIGLADAVQPMASLVGIIPRPTPAR